MGLFSGQSYQDYVNALSESQKAPTTFDYNIAANKAAGDFIQDKTKETFGNNPFSKITGELATYGAVPAAFLSSPFHEAIQVVKEDKLKDYSLPYSGDLANFTKAMLDQRVPQTMAERAAGVLQSTSLGQGIYDLAGRTQDIVSGIRQRNPGITGTGYFDDVNISQAPGTDVGSVGKTLSGFAKSIGDLFSGSAIATEADVAKAIADRAALDRQGLMALDDAGLVTPAYEDFAQVARPGLNLGFAKQLGKRLGTGILTALSLPAGLAAKVLSGMPGRVGVQGGVALRGDTNLDTFGRSTSFADFAQRMRDKRAREAAATRGSVKDLQSRIDRGDFGGNNNAGKDTSGASGGAPGGGADASTY